MRGSKKIIILAVLLIVTCVLGVCFGGILLKHQHDFTKNINLSVNGKVNQDLNINLNGFYPGVNKDYQVTFTSQYADDYKITLTFIKQSFGTLENYIDTEILLDGKIIYQSKLSQIISVKRLDSFVFSVDKNKITTLTFRFKMGLDVTNEAQNATTDFILNMDIQKAIN